jgi:2-amino-4-hydroxy-6-hydroxymethyldihydropteridine diphosphokinase
LLAESVEVVGASRVFETDPVATRSMPQFLNAAVELVTDLEPGILKFEVLRPAEATLGRRRTRDRNAPRQIDLDVALYGDRVFVDSEVGLEIPDPGILEFAHVALPLADAAPLRRHPVSGRTMADIAARFGSHPGVRLAADADALRGKLPTLAALR